MIAAFIREMMAPRGLTPETLYRDAMHILKALLDTEYQDGIITRRHGIYQALEKCFDTSSRSPTEAIAHAHYLT